MPFSGVVQLPFKLKKILVSGYVLEAESSEDLIGAIIQVENTDIAVVTNTYGYYALSLLPGSYRIQCSFLGLQESIVEVTLIDSNIVLNFELASDEDFLQEVVVTGERWKMKMYHPLTWESLTWKPLQ